MTMNDFHSRKSDSPERGKFENGSAPHGVFLNQKAGHVGLMFFDGGTKEAPIAELKTLEFRADRILSEPLSLAKEERGHFLYAELGCVPQFNAIGFTGYLMALSRNQAALRYGFGWSDVIGIFDMRGSFIEPSGDYGLTCATFLAELFYGYSIKLFNMESWPRDADIDRQFLADFKTRRTAAARDGRGQLSEETIRELVKVSPFIRLHPTEVAAVAASPKRPQLFEHPEAKALADKVLADFAAASRQHQ